MRLYALDGHHSWFSWSSLTWFGDTALLLPAAAALGLAFLLRPGARMLAFRWALAFGSVGFLVLATKIAFIGWGIGNAAADFTGLSGHSALSAVFWPVVGWIAARNHGVVLRRLAIGGGVAFALGIGLSRLVLHLHSPSEVVSGLLVGFSASAWLIGSSRQGVGPLRTVVSFAAVFVLGLILVRHGTPAPTTQLIEVTVVRLLGKTEPYTRDDLRAGRI
ncbi:hypothetical protein GT347_02705 [Xylophilus rhododendri]|uniref:Uncharacterized protein n=1 Tax=Xylophilus rhododendri TaxID=2697032 RepID=A0A857IZG1_9BURK|nr:phosphatase PAP2 family protein [Xylophilus rhododendri]QHI96990.1 hypothetical protein GT347_02705 [Xylophilus rhododendri]